MRLLAVAFRHTSPQAAVTGVGGAFCKAIGLATLSKHSGMLAFTKPRSKALIFDVLPAVGRRCHKHRRRLLGRERRRVAVRAVGVSEQAGARRRAPRRPPHAERERGASSRTAPCETPDRARAPARAQPLFIPTRAHPLITARTRRGCVELCEHELAYFRGFKKSRRSTQRGGATSRAQAGASVWARARVRAGAGRGAAHERARASGRGLPRYCATAVLAMKRANAAAGGAMFLRSGSAK